MTAFSSMLDRLFEGPLGVDATWWSEDPAIGTLGVRILWKSPDDVFRGGLAGGEAPARIAEVRVSELASVAEGDIFTPTDGADAGVEFTVARASKRDSDRLVWTLEVE